MDEKGNIISQKEPIERDMNEDLFINRNEIETKEEKKKDFSDISDYKPSGKLVYNPEMLEKIERRVSFS